jgi:hypothetical protein
MLCCRRNSAARGVSHPLSRGGGGGGEPWPASLTARQTLDPMTRELQSRPGFMPMSASRLILKALAMESQEISSSTAQKMEQPSIRGGGCPGDACGGMEGGGGGVERGGGDMSSAILVVFAKPVVAATAVMVLGVEGGGGMAAGVGGRFRFLSSDSVLKRRFDKLQVPVEFRFYIGNTAFAIYKGYMQ